MQVSTSAKDVQEKESVCDRERHSKESEKNQTIKQNDGYVELVKSI